MAGQLDSMSNAELRNKLTEHGFPIMPITESTKKLLVKKLKMVLENKTKLRKSVCSKVKNRQSLARYSSDLESDLVSTNSTKAKRGRRATAGEVTLPPVTSKTRQILLKKDSPIKLSESQEDKSPLRSLEVETITTRRAADKRDEAVADFTTSDQVDSMSNAELRNKLTEHGFPIMPITESTRKLLIKKLKMVLDKKTEPRKSLGSKVKSRGSLARYSNGLEPDLVSTNSTKAKRGRRASPGGVMLPPMTSKTRLIPLKKDSPIKRDTGKGSDSKEEKSSLRTYIDVESVRTRRGTRLCAANKRDETGSDKGVVKY